MEVLQAQVHASELNNVDSIKCLLRATEFPIQSSMIWAIEVELGSLLF